MGSLHLGKSTPQKQKRLLQWNSLFLFQSLDKPFLTISGYNRVYRMTELPYQDYIWFVSIVFHLDLLPFLIQV